MNPQQSPLFAANLQWAKPLQVAAKNWKNIYLVTVYHSGQSYKASTIVIYDSIVVNMCNLLVTMTLGS